MDAVAASGAPDAALPLSILLFFLDLWVVVGDVPAPVSWDGCLVDDVHSLGSCDQLAVFDITF
jgi:hypothetical protein